MTHTKGEWKSEINLKADKVYIWCGGVLIAEMNTAYVEYPESDDEIKANAQLIECAPQIIEAIKYARRFLKSDDVDTAYIDSVISKAESPT